MITNTKFPKQQVSSKSKTKSWFKECVTSGITIAMDETNSIRPLTQDMKRNFDLYDGIVDKEDLKKHFDTLNLFKANYNPSFKHFSSIRDRIDVLVGEYIDRGEEYVIASIDREAINKKLIERTEKARELVNDVLESGDVDRFELRTRLQEFNPSKYRSKSEVAANKIVEIYKKLNNVEMKKVEGFKEALISAGAIFAVDVVGGELKVRKCNLMTTYPVRNGNSADIKDSEMIAEVRYLPVGKILDEFGDELTKTELKRLLDGELNRNGESSESENARISTTYRSTQDLELFSKGGQYNESLIDDDGNIRVVRFVWKGYRKVYKRKYYDSSGEAQTDYVSEHYKADKEKGEDLEERYFAEWHEGTQIGGDIVTKAKVREVQFRSLTNPSTCKSGYVGGYFNVSENRAKSIIDLVFPYLYMRDMIFARIEDLMSKNIGKVLELDTSVKPESWTVKQWLYYVKAHGLMVVNRMNESTKGASQGKIAGAYNTGARAVDMELGNSITSYIELMRLVDEMISKVTGIPEQRLGAIKTRESVGNVERSTVQSSHITEYWFKRYEQMIMDLYSTILDTSKIVLNKDVRLQAVLDDFSFSILNVDIEDFKSTELGLFPINSSKYARLRQSLEQIALNAIPNGQMTHKQFISIYTKNNTAEVIDAFEMMELDNEKKKQLEGQQEHERQVQLQQEGINAAKAQDEANKKHEYNMLMLELENKKELKRMDMLNSIQGDLLKGVAADSNGNEVEDEVEILKQGMIIDQKDRELMLKEKEVTLKNEIEKEKLKLLKSQSKTTKK